MKKIFFLLFPLLLFFCELEAQSIDSTYLNIAVDTHNLKSAKQVNQYFLLIESYNNKLAPDTLLPYYRKALTSAQSFQIDTLAQKCALIIGQIHSNKGNLKKSRTYRELALTLAQKSQVTSLIANTYNHLGVQYILEGKIIEAVDIFLKIIENEDDSQKTKDVKNSVYNNLSYSYFSLGEYQEATKYLKLQVAVFKKDNRKLNIHSLSLAYYGLIECYKKSNQLDSIDFYLEKYVVTTNQLKADTTSNFLEYEFTVGNNYINIVNLYLEKGELDKAKIYYESLNKLNYFDEGDKYLLDINYAVTTAQFSIAEKLIDYQPIDLYIDSLAFYKILAVYYDKTNDFEKSLFYTNIYKDKEIEKQRSQRIKLSSYTQSRIQAINTKQHLKEVQREQIYQGRFNKMAYGIIGLLILILGLLYYAYSQIQKRNKYLQQDLANKAIIEQQNKKLQQAEQQKNRLFTNIAHEFQTPLNIIGELTKEVSNKEKLTKNGLDALNLVIKNSSYLSKTTNQILSINFPSQKNTRDNPIAFSLVELLNYILPEYKFLAKQKSLTLIIPDFKEEAIIMHTDVHKMETILKNLLSNAIKYSEKAGTISVDYQITESNQHQIKVIDDGRGINQEDLPTLFNRYFQADTNEAEGGFGLGLAICKEYIESMSGKITVDSEYGKWTTFTILLPFNNSVIANTPTLYQFPSTVHPISTEIERKLKNNEEIPLPEILIVEDNLDYCRFLAVLLEKDYYLVFVHDGEKALDYLKDHHPTLIITDWMMPSMDGLALIQALKHSEKYNHFPILMLTAKSLISDKLKALRVGIDDYLIKPIEKEVLKNRINVLIRAKNEKEATALEFPFSEVEIADLKLSLAEQEWITKIEKLIMPLIGDYNLNREHIANLSEVSVKQLNQRIKKITGLTTKRYIQEIRYWEARRLLETGVHTSVKVVSYMVGFKDAKNFSRRFKERFGKYPSEYLN